MAPHGRWATARASPGASWWVRGEPGSRALPQRPGAAWSLAGGCRGRDQGRPVRIGGPADPRYPLGQAGVIGLGVLEDGNAVPRDPRGSTVTGMSTTPDWLLIATGLGAGVVGSVITTYGTQTRERRQ